MDELRTRIDDWLETVPAPGPPDLDGAVGRGRRLRRARSVGWSAAAVVAAAAVAVGALALRPGPSGAVVPAGPRTEVRYPDGVLVAWPAPAGGAWFVDGVDVQDEDGAGQQLLLDDLARAVPGSSSVDQAPLGRQYRMGWNGRIAEYFARVVVERSGRRAYVTIRMTRGGLAAGGRGEPWDPCGHWPGSPSLGDAGRGWFAGPVDCRVGRDERVGSIVHVFDPELADRSVPMRWRSSFTVRPDGSAVSASVQGQGVDLDALGTPSSWQRLLDDLAADLPYPAGS